MREIAAAVGASAPTVRVLDVSSDAEHNRSVLTLAGDPAGLTAGVLALFAQALDVVDLRTHRGEHPRMGAVDVVPFVPIEGVTMAECVALARTVGEQVASRFGVPVYLYEEAARTRRGLEDTGAAVRRAAAKMATPWRRTGPAAHIRPPASAIGAGAIAYTQSATTIAACRRNCAAVRHPRRPALRQGLGVMLEATASYGCR